MKCRPATSLTQTYNQFIKQKIVPELQALTQIYEEWWEFKPDSTLATYLLKNDHRLPPCFTPATLCASILQIANENNLFATGNADILLPDRALQDALSNAPHIIFVKSLDIWCFPHMKVIDAAKTTELKNAHIHRDFCPQPPITLVTQDPAARFCLHPFFNAIIANNKQFVYTWDELVATFYHFLCTNKTHIQRYQDTIFSIKVDSELRSRLNFNIFHRTQIPQLLHHICKFIGTPSSVISTCKDLHFKDLDEKSPVVNYFSSLVLSNPLTPFQCNVYLD